VARRFFVLLLLLTLATACSYVATQTSFYHDVWASAAAHDWQSALGVVEAAKEEGKYKNKDRLLYFLDRGILHHYAGQPEESNTYLEQAERTIEELYTASISKAAFSMVLNDNTLDYSGEDYEDIYTNVFKALNYIALGEYDEARVEIRRVDNKLTLLQQKYGKLAEAMNEQRESPVKYKAAPVKFHNDALARYLGALLYFQDGQYDDARIDLEQMQKAVQSQPNIYPFSPPEMSLADLDTSVLHVMAFAGRGPEKVAVNFRIRTYKNYFLVYPVTSRARYGQRYVWQGLESDLYFKFSVPVLKSVPSMVHHVNVYVNKQFVGRLQLLEDMSRVAKETFEAHRSLIYMKSMIRAVLKGLANKKAKDEIDKSGKNRNGTNREEGAFGRFLLKTLADVAVEVTEQADLRCWRLMPGKAYAGYFPVPEGSYSVSVRFLDAQDRLLSESRYDNVEIRRSRLNLVEAAEPN